MKLSIDPGISGTGIAVWDLETWKRRSVNPLAIKNLYPKDGEDFIEKTDQLLVVIERTLEEWNIGEVWCEMPEFFDTSGGHMVAKKGDLAKLTFFVGAVAGLCWSKSIIFHPVTPATWKGQTSKEMVERKIHDILPKISELNPKSHSYDAIGIGLWAQGLYKRV